MLRALYTSATGMRAQESLIDNTANNIANVNTTGFKKSYLNFADLLYSTQRAPGTEIATGQVSPTGLQIGSGVRVVGTTKSFNPGVPEQTGGKFDVMIEGDGFFKVLIPGGEFRYTRDGSFTPDATGQLVTKDGYILQPPITVSQDAKDVTIGVDGTVSVTVAGQSTPQSIGSLQIVKFLNPAGLSSEGGNLYSATGASGNEVPGTPGQVGFGAIRQGTLEKSNVEVVTELISLITAQRAYEVNSRAIRAGDEMLSTTNDIVR